MASIYQCIPNFSEGRRPEVVAAIVQAIQDTSGVLLIDSSSDPDHHRCVMTFLGDATAVRAAVRNAARVAVERIDLRAHRGVHPRAGAIDVVPVVPLRDAGRGDAVELSRNIGEDLASMLDIPVYFYEWSARTGRQTALPDLRRGGFEAFVATPLVGERAPDLGPARAHPTAGVTVVGARGPLIAYNIQLASSDVGVARALARRIRHERDRTPILTGVRALGLFLPSRNCAQVSMNLTQPEHTPLPGVFRWVRQAAAERGVAVQESEIIGVIPQAALGQEPPEAILWHTYRPAQILEHWLHEVDISSRR